MTTAQCVNLVVVPAGWKVFKFADEIIIPRRADDFDVAGLRLCADWLGARRLISGGRLESHIEAVQCPRCRLRLVHASSWGAVFTIAFSTAPGVANIRRTSST